MLSSSFLYSLRNLKPTDGGMGQFTLCWTIGFVLATAPAEARKKEPTEVATQPAPPPVAAPAIANGAIFQAGTPYAPFTSGSRATAVGDILTIVLVERTQAEKSATGATDRSGNIGLTLPTTGALALFPPSASSMGGASSFNGKGATTQSNALQGEISVAIVAVYPNGTMLIRGQKTLRLNRGDEFISISGLVRAADIRYNNSVLSSRVADAKISYTGKGDLARASRPGWLQRFFSVISPF